MKEKLGLQQHLVSSEKYRCSHLCADTVTIGGGCVASLATSIGQAKDVVGLGSPMKMGFYVITNFAFAINSARFGLDKVRSTVSGLGKTVSVYSSKVKSVFFNCRIRPTPEEEPLLAPMIRG